MTARGSSGTALFIEDLDRLDFLELLRSTTDLFGWRRHGHCLMGTHYHLLLATSIPKLSAGMQRLNSIYAMRFNRRYGRRGHLFGSRYSAYVLRDERHLAAALEYVIQNPVRAGLCERAQDWQWAAMTPG